VMSGILALLLVGATLTGTRLPLISTDRIALIALVVVSMGMCSYGAGRGYGLFGWLNPFTFLGMAVGLVILAIFVGRLAGWTLPLITTDRDAILAIAALEVGKVLVGGAQALVFKPAR
jgi:hypothetical protein